MERSGGADEGRPHVLSHVMSSNTRGAPSKSLMGSFHAHFPYSAVFLDVLQCVLVPGCGLLKPGPRVVEWGFLKIGGTCLGVLIVRDNKILGSMLGPPY